MLFWCIVGETEMMVALCLDNAQDGPWRRNDVPVGERQRTNSSMLEPRDIYGGESNSSGAIFKNAH
jgi:hypothetical protein